MEKFTTDVWEDWSKVATAQTRPSALNQNAAAQSVKAAVRRACELCRGPKFSCGDIAKIHAVALNVSFTKRPLQERSQI